MNNKILLPVFLLVLASPNNAFGQDSAQIIHKYGKPIAAYSVRQHIWMTPEFADNGQVCEMRLYPKRISATANYLSDKLDYRELEVVLNELAPPDTRGKPTMFFGLSNAGGFRQTTIYNYERVEISFLTSVSPYIDPIETGKPTPEAPPTQSQHSHAQTKTESVEQLIVPRDVEIVTIVWNERPCSKE